MKRTNEAGHVATFWQHVHVPNSNRKLASGLVSIGAVVIVDGQVLDFRQT
jgi:hypothetical protein